MLTDNTNLYNHDNHKTEYKMTHHRNTAILSLNCCVIIVHLVKNL